MIRTLAIGAVTNLCPGNVSVKSRRKEISLSPQNSVLVPYSEKDTRCTTPNQLNVLVESLVILCYVRRVSGSGLVLVIQY
jgi:hypothetical protein